MIQNCTLVLGILDLPRQNLKMLDRTASRIVEMMGKGTIEISKEKNHQHEANLLQLNCDKASQILGWSPRWNVEKTIEETSNWYNAYLNGGDMQLVSNKQILDYFGGEIN